jgi:hypothetical protein
MDSDSPEQVDNQLKRSEYADCWPSFEYRADGRMNFD